MRAPSLILVGLVGCAYRPDSFHSSQYEFAGQHATAGCLDLSIERRPDLPTGETVLAYEFGNRCRHPTVVDLAKAGVVGRTVDGKTLDLVAIDPRHEIAALVLDSCASGGEAIAYRGKSELANICVDPASIAHATPGPWLCFANTEPTEDR